MNKNLSSLGFKLPAEWEKQNSIWITWPYNKKDWPGLFKFIPKIVSEIVSQCKKRESASGFVEGLKSWECLFGLKKSELILKLKDHNFREKIKNDLKFMTINDYTFTKS